MKISRKAIILLGLLHVMLLTSCKSSKQNSGQKPLVIDNKEEEIASETFEAYKERVQSQFKIESIRSSSLGSFIVTVTAIDYRDFDPPAFYAWVSNEPCASRKILDDDWSPSPTLHVPNNMPPGSYHICAEVHLDAKFVEGNTCIEYLYEAGSNSVMAHDTGYVFGDVYDLPVNGIQADTTSLAEISYFDTYNDLLLSGNGNFIYSLRSNTQIENYPTIPGEEPFHSRGKYFFGSNNTLFHSFYDGTKLEVYQLGADHIKSEILTIAYIAGEFDLTAIGFEDDIIYLYEKTGEEYSLRQIANQTLSAPVVIADPAIITNLDSYSKNPAEGIFVSEVFINQGVHYGSNENGIYLLSDPLQEILNLDLSENYKDMDKFVRARPGSDFHLTRTQKPFVDEGRRSLNMDYAKTYCSLIGPRKRFFRKTHGFNFNGAEGIIQNFETVTHAVHAASLHRTVDSEFDIYLIIIKHLDKNINYVKLPAEISNLDSLNIHGIRGGDRIVLSTEDSFWILDTRVVPLLTPIGDEGF